MKPLERIKATLSYGPVDCTPVFLPLNGFFARKAGISLAKYLNDTETVVEVALAAVRQFPSDIIPVFLDSCVEAEALGANVVFSDSAYPHLSNPLLTGWREVRRLTVPDPWSAGRIPLFLEAAKRILDRDGGEHFIVGQVLGPVTIASQIYGIENLIYLIVDEPEGFLELIRFTAKIAARTCEALLQTGVHGIMLHDPSASPDVVSKQVFTQHIAPELNALVRQIKKNQNAVLWLQITGNTTSVLPSIAEMDLEMITVDSPVNLSYALDILKNKVVVGNINPMMFRNGSRDDLSGMGIRLKEQSREFGYIIGTGCEIPLDATEENIKDVLELMGRK